MTEIEALQEQISRLEKTVSELQNGTVKVVPLKVQISHREMEIFEKYFISSDVACHENNKNAKRAMNRDCLRYRIRELAREIFKVNVGGVDENILKILREEDMVTKYLETYEETCKFAYKFLETDYLKKG